MIGLRINEAFLDLEPGASMEVEINNPLFNQDTETGLFTYDVTAPLSKTNKRLLNFPGALSVRAYRKTPWPCQLWLGNRLQLFRVGKLKVLDRTGNGYRLSFLSDAADMAAAADDHLRDLDLGTDALSLTVKSTYPTDKYALFPVKNPGFYDKDKNPEFSKYLNYYHGVFPVNSAANNYSITPFPYLCHILERVFAHYSYFITGTWFTSTAARKLCIYNTRALDKRNPFLNEFDTAIDFKNHVPDLTVAEFLKAIRKRCGLAFVFNSKAKEVELVKLTDALNDTGYDDWTTITQPDYNWQPNQTDGFSLEMAPDSNDELQKDSADWLQIKVGNGKEKIETAVGTLQDLTETDEINSGRSWTIPEADQVGNSPEFDLGTDNEFGLRLLSYEGLQNDSLGDPYPQGRSFTWADTFSGDYESWLTFLSETETIGRTAQLGMLHLQQLHPLRKILIKAPEGTVKAFWQKIQFTVTAQKRISAKVTFYKSMQ